MQMQNRRVPLWSIFYEKVGYICKKKLNYNLSVGSFNSYDIKTEKTVYSTKRVKRVAIS